MVVAGPSSWTNSRTLPTCIQLLFGKYPSPKVLKYRCHFKYTNCPNIHIRILIYILGLLSPNIHIKILICLLEQVWNPSIHIRTGQTQYEYWLFGDHPNIHNRFILFTTMDVAKEIYLYNMERQGSTYSARSSSGDVDGGQSRNEGCWREKTILWMQEGDMQDQQVCLLCSSTPLRITLSWGTQSDMSKQYEWLGWVAIIYCWGFHIVVYGFAITLNQQMHWIVLVFLK
jgi:hypothetical protein